MRGQLPVGVLLTEPHIQAGGLHLAGIQRIQQGGFVHVGAAGDVDDDHTIAHLGNALSIHQCFVTTGSAQHDDIGTSQQLIHGDELHGPALAAFRLVAMYHRQDVHPQCLGFLAYQLADAAIADDAHGLAHQLKALGISLLFPLLLTHGVTGDRDVASAGEQQGDGQLRHGVGGCPGSVLHSDACRLCILDGDVVHTDTGTDNELQAAILGRIDLRLFDFCGRTDNDRIKIPQGCAQFIGFIELLNHFKSIFAQLLHGTCIHTVSNQNSH